MTDDEIIEVVRAHKEGKEIQAIIKGSTQEGWYSPKRLWNFDICDYRVKPEPRKPREWWVIKRDPRLYHDEFVAYECKQSCCEKEQIHVREVIE